jgi:hypothetical protein
MRSLSTVFLLSAPVTIAACGGATRATSSPHPAQLTGATIAPHIERLVVVEEGKMSMVGREGCAAMLQTAAGEAGPSDELRVRCPKPGRIDRWFEGVDRVMAGFLFEPAPEEEEERALPAARVITTSKKMLRVAKKTDVERLVREVGSLSAELASAEQPSPGPASPAGWQMLHVTGPAHVLFAGSPAHGVLDARMSTSGQYFCEFTMSGGEGPMRATKSGWITPTTATSAIDRVLVPWSALGPNERSKTTYAAGMTNGSERRSSASSTPAVLERFVDVQTALGDACLPEVEAEPIGF